jgi:hypothetical protein
LEQGVTDIFAPIEGATPVPPDDQKELVPTWIQSRGDLNLAEKDNIASGLGLGKTQKAKAC